MSEHIEEKFNTRQNKQRKGYRDQLKPSGKTVKYNIHEARQHQASTISGLDVLPVSLDKKERWEVFTKQNPDIVVLQEFANKNASNRLGDLKKYNEAQIVKKKKKKEDEEEQRKLEEQPEDPNHKFNERKARRLANKEKRNAAKNKSDQDEDLSSGDEDDKEVFVITKDATSASEFPLFGTEKSGRYSPEWALGIEKNHWVKKRRNITKNML